MKTFNECRLNNALQFFYTYNLSNERVLIQRFKREARERMQSYFFEEFGLGDIILQLNFATHNEILYL